MILKVLIVDDEALARIGIRTIIPWEEYGFQIVGEAASVTEAKELSYKYSPDIIMLDIAMPGKDGFQLVQQIEDKLPWCKFVIVSCMNDLKHYKKAVNTGVSAFIEKSTIDKTSLTESLKGIRKQIEKEYFLHRRPHEQNNRNNEQELSNYVNKLIKNVNRDSNTLKVPKHFPSSDTYFVLSFSEHDISFIANNTSEHAIDTFKNLIMNIIRDNGNGFFFHTNYDKWNLLFGCSSEMENNRIENIRKMGFRITQSVGQIFDIDLSIGISNSISNLSMIKEGFDQAVHARDSHFINRDTKAICFCDIKPHIDRAASKIQEIKTEIVNVQTATNVSTIHECLVLLYETIKKSSCLRISEIQNLYIDIIYHIIEILRKDSYPIEQIFFENFNPVVFIRDFENLDCLHQGMLGVIENVRNYFNSLMQDRHSHAIILMKQFINEHVDDKISLKDISDYVFLSTNYISRLFKQKTGESICNYINKVKIERAKNILIDNHTISSTAEKLGFSSESYFIQVFKQHTGKTPKQFLS